MEKKVNQHARKEQMTQVDVPDSHYKGPVSPAVEKITGGVDGRVVKTGPHQIDSKMIWVDHTTGKEIPVDRKGNLLIDPHYDPDTFVDVNNTHTPAAQENDKSAGSLLPRSTNPKDRVGLKKPPIHLVPAVAIIHEAMAFKNGAEKYGPYNWRGESVSASVYIAACYRHLMVWFDGEEFALDSRVHHLGHARACLAIILDAGAAGMLVDDRPKLGGSAALLISLTTSSEKGNASEHEQGQQSEGASHRPD